ncbi:MAG: hypothetical protein RLZZ305_1128 [Actinomycetota bacterium]|jgi:4-nitrophenyl phosphatase
MGKKTALSAVVCDLDGVVWLSHREIAGASAAVNRLREAGVRVVFVTNASFTTRAEVEGHLAAIGVDAEGDVLTSAMAAAGSVRPGSSVLLCGGAGLREELEHVGCHVTAAHEVPGTRARYDAVVVGLYREFDYRVLEDCMRAVRGGARLIGSNADNSYPTPDGPVPGGGAVLAAIAVAAGVEPEVCGKPHEPMARLVRAWLGRFDPAELAVVGDKVSTDGVFAQTLGCRFGFVLSGVGESHEAPAGCLMADNLADMVELLLA